MSASPLPAVRTISPASSKAPSLSGDPASQRADGTAFHAHLRDAQRPPPRATEAAGDRSPSATPANDKNAASSAAAGSAGSAKTPDSSDGRDGVDGQADAGSTSLATQVLGLIDQASGEASTAAASSTAPTDGKPAGGSKPPPQDDAGKPAPPTAVLPAAMMLAPPAPLPASAGNQSAAQGSNGAAAAIASLTTTVASGLTPGKLLGAFSDADADDGSDGGATVGDAGGHVLAAGADAGVASSIGGLFGGAHNALPDTTPATTAAGQAADTGDLANLRGVLGSAALTAPPVPAGNAMSHSLNIQAPVNTPGFSQELSQQVTWLGGQEIKQAQIRLNPQELGPLDVKVSVEHGRVDVVFSAQHPATVAAVQQSLDQLGQMLGGHGLSLGQSTVGQQAAQQQSGHSPGQASASAAISNDAEPIGGVAASTQPLAAGLIDAFA